MTFAATTKPKLVNILELHRDQAISGSMLSTLMTETENFDSDHGTTYVADIESAITAIEALDVAIAAAAESDGLTEIDIFRRTNIRREAGTATKPALDSRRSHVANIRRLLDPENYLERSSLSARVIPTL